jgi:leucyl-tRNA---protein transferase
MFAEVQSPDNLTAVELDAFLERGWFRMGQTIFTTNFLNFKNDFYSALWLRLNLHDYIVDKVETKLTRLNSKFRVDIQPFKLDEENEKLYAVYRESVSFEASSSLHQLMYRDSIHDIFTTLSVNVYDGDSLIACGLFDLGKSSAAGITSFYNPQYKKYSLGKFLIYQKIRYCREHAIKYFYPGYFVPGYAAFDYKLSIGTRHLYFLEYKTQRWMSIDTFKDDAAPLQQIIHKLQLLQQIFQEWGVEVRLLYYDFFDANLIPGLQGINLFDVPAFIYPIDVEEEIVQPVITYDLRGDKYHLLKCLSVWKSNYPKSDRIYASHLLKIDNELFSTDDPEEMVTLFISAMSSKVSSMFPGEFPNQT